MHKVESCPYEGKCLLLEKEFNHYCLLYSLSHEKYYAKEVMSIDFTSDY